MRTKMIKRFNDGRDWFFEKRFGLFVHWGLYAIPAWHEQLQWRRNIQRKEYEELVKEFNPEKFDPEQWLDLVEEAGMEYICFTTKHHDGFCMWDTKESDYNIMKTPYQQDILAMLADACHKRDIPLCLYYSVADWHHPNYPNQGRHHEIPPQSGDDPHMEKYMEFLKAQIKELCSNYGEIHGIWWDMNVSHHRDLSVHKIIRELQPKAVINDRGFDTGVKRIENGDFTTSERELPETRCFEVPTEACDSLCVNSWGYKKDADFFSDKFLMQCIDKSLSMGGNYLLNVGPAADGTIQSEFVNTLKKIGRWYKAVKVSFSGEPASELIDSQQFFVTRSGDDLYIHLNPDHNSSVLNLKPIASKPEKIILLNNGQELDCVIDSDTQLCFNAEDALRIRNIPVNEFNDEVMVIKLPAIMAVH